MVKMVSRMAKVVREAVRKIYPANVTALVSCGIVIYAIISAVCGVGVFGGKERLAPLVDERVVVAGTVKGDPREDEMGIISATLRGGVLVEAGSDTTDDNISPNEYTAKWSDETAGDFYITGRINDLERGDRVAVEGVLSEGFGRYAGVIYRGEVVAHQKPIPESVTLRLRKSFGEKVRGAFARTSDDETVAEREANLGLAYLLGEKNGLDAETQEVLKLVGLSHLVVASGTHLGILVGFFKKYFGKISRFAGMLFALAFVGIFGTMIGWTASITRAAIVTGVSIIGWYGGRQVAAWRMILLAMAITLLIDPMYVIDLGWQLSFASFVGIMMLAPEMKKFFYASHEKVGVVAEMLLASVAATVMCAPILLYYFGQLSLISVIANILILPTMPAAMGLVFAVGILGYVSGGAGAISLGVIIGGVQAVATWATKLILEYHLVVMEWFAKQTAFLVQIPAKDWRVLLMYLPIAGMLVAVEMRRAVRERQRIKLYHARPEKYLRFEKR